jgi:hypothetical protein
VSVASSIGRRYGYLVLRVCMMSSKDGRAQGWDNGPGFVDHNVGTVLIFVPFRRPTIYVVLFVVSSWKHSVSRTRDLCQQNQNGMSLQASYGQLVLSFETKDLTCIVLVRVHIPCRNRIVSFKFCLSNHSPCLKEQRHIMLVVHWRCWFNESYID